MPETRPNVLWPLVAFPALKLIVHLLTANGYGYFRDEFYYLACSRRMAWGYVDHPPLSVAAIWAWRHAFGESMLAIRALAALGGAATVLVTGLIVRALGGGTWALSLAMLCVLIAPEYLAVDGFSSMNTFDLLLWTLAAYVLVLILHHGRDGLWPALGLVLGLGLLNKLSVLWLGLGLAVGLVATGERRRVLTVGPWIAAAIAAALVAPHLAWQIRHGWPTAEFIHNATAEKMRAISPLSFAMAQVDNQQPLTAPVWLAGLAYSLFAAGARRLRPLGFIYLTVFGLLIVNQKSRTGYLAPAYPMLLALGAVWIAAHVERPALRAGILALIAAGGAVTAPLALAMLPPPTYVRYAAALGVAPSTEENKDVGPLPQFFADRFGWPELVERVSAAAQTLAPQERARCVVFTSNYGEAGAVELLGRTAGLSPVASGHNNYWLWGPPRAAPEAMLVVTRPASEARLRERCGSVTDTGAIGCTYCMPYERETHVYVCRTPRPTLAELWPRLKHYD